MNRCVSSLALTLPLFIAACLISFHANADSSVTTQRTVTKVDTGVYVIRHADGADTNPQGNTTVIVGERDVLVIDSSYLADSAAEDIAQIHQWTDKPVRYLLNTHWHPDHVRGNAMYADAFPNLAIIAHPQTVRLMATYEAGNIDRYPKRLEALRTSLAQGRDASGKRLDAKAKEELRATIAIRSAVFAQIQKSPMLLPNVTFDQELNIDLGNRMVELRHSGTGDTLGDVWAYLPKERILVTGDVLTAPVPYFFAGYPDALAKTLRHLLELDVAAVIPGHGDVMRDKTYMRAVADLMETVIVEVNAAIARIGSLSSQLEDVRKQLGTHVDIAKYRRQFAGDDPGSQEYFDESIEGLIKEAFYQAPK